MTCFTIKGCERLALAPFVAHLNCSEDASYTHRTCLHSPNRKQPEELFVDEFSGSALVIERKSIAWPEDYEYGHAKDHVVAEVIFDQLKGMTFGSAYVLRLPYLIKDNEREAREFALDVAARIRSNLNSLEEHRAIGPRSSGHSWSFYEASTSWELPDDAPARGVTILWDERVEDFFINPDELPDKLSKRLCRILDACELKFADWSHARRILVLDQLGALRYKSRDWWQRVFLRHRPPPAIGEIWLGIFDWLDDWEQGWIFEKLWQS